MGCFNHPGVTASLVRCAGCLRRFCRACVERRGHFYQCAQCRTGTAPAPLPLIAAAPVHAPAASTSEQPLASDVPVPDMEPASLGRRAFALVIDSLIVWFVLAILLSFVPGRAELLRLILIVGLPIAYEALFLQQTGQTIGKSMLDIQVVSKNFESVGDAQAWLRGAFKLAQFTCCGLAFLTAVFSDGNRALHDLMANTRVVNAGRRSSLTR